MVTYVWRREAGGIVPLPAARLLAGLPAPEPQLDDSTTSVNNLTTGASKTQCEQVITLFFFCWRNTTTKAVYGVGDWPNKQASK